MSISSPTVSILMTTYNHEKYIGKALQSVLAQSYRDLEVVLVNDGSTDRTEQIIQGFSDPRIHYIYQENRGPSGAAKRALDACRGKYIAFMSGDDTVPPERIQTQLAEYRRGDSRVLFSAVQLIDDDDRPTKAQAYVSNQTPAHGRDQVLRRLFEGSCPVFTLTMFLEKRLLTEEPLTWDPSLYQLQDYDLLIRLVKKYDFSIMKESLYNYRVHTGLHNLSAPEPDKVIRTQNEFFLLMRRVFDNMPADLFKAAFKDLLQNPSFHSEAEYLCEQAFLLTNTKVGLIPLLGLERLCDLLRNPETAQVLKTQYGFGPPEFAEQARQVNVSGAYLDQQTRLYVDTGRSFNEKEAFSILCNRNAESFSLTFDLSRFKNIRAVRWDPVEVPCRISLTSVSCRDKTGQCRTLDLSSLRPNADSCTNGVYIFETLDPWFEVPISGPVTSITFTGKWQIPDLQNICIQAALHKRILAQKKAEQELAAIRACRSVRLTAPLRSLASVIRKPRRSA